jgi:hypothetical protein
MHSQLPAPNATEFCGSDCAADALQNAAVAAKSESAAIDADRSTKVRFDFFIKSPGY